LKQAPRTTLRPHWLWPRPAVGPDSVIRCRRDAIEMAFLTAASSKAKRRVSAKVRSRWKFHRTASVKLSGTVELAWHRRAGSQARRSTLLRRCSGRPAGPPLWRFCPLQHVPTARRCSVLPTSERSRCGAWPVARMRGSASRLRPCGFSLHAGGPMIDRSAWRRPRGHASPLLYVRCSATRTRAFAAWPGLAAMAALLGFLPFAVLLLPAGLGTSPSLTPHLPFPERPSRSIFIGRSAAFGMSTRPWRSRNGRSRTFSAAPGICPRGQSVPVGACRAGRDCLGLHVLFQAFGRVQTRCCGLWPANSRQPPETTSSPYPLVGLRQQQVRYCDKAIVAGASLSSPSLQRFEGLTPGRSGESESLTGPASCMRFCTVCELKPTCVSR